ncbi:hypothetical protein SDJN03_00997, partial [Cucurbita argyrosperma subsp. sororia]
MRSILDCVRILMIYDIETRDAHKLAHCNSGRVRLAVHKLNHSQFTGAGWIQATYSHQMSEALHTSQPTDTACPRLWTPNFPLGSLVSGEREVPCIRVYSGEYCWSAHCFTVLMLKWLIFTYPIHRYCLDALPKTFDEYVTWFCEDCEAIMMPAVKSDVKLKKKKCVEQSKKNDTTPGGLGEQVREGGANHGEVTTSSDASNFLRHNCYVARPIVDPIWRGTLKFWVKSFARVGVLVAHMSSLACSKVYEEAKSLPESLPVELLCRCEIWPRGFEKLGPTDLSIALYFFPEDERSQRAFDLLVNAMMCKDLAMKAVLKNAELLVFTSSMLPMRYWRFQTKYYLWGVFRGKQVAQPRNNVASERSFTESLPCDDEEVRHEVRNDVHSSYLISALLRPFTQLSKGLVFVLQCHMPRREEGA